MTVDRYNFGGLLFSINYEYTKINRYFCKLAGLYNGQPRVLTILKDNEGCTLSELSHLCGIGMPSLSVSVRNMIKTGLIKRHSAGNGSRTQQLYLTETGLKKALAFHELIDKFNEDLLASFDENDAEQLVRSLSLLSKYFKDFNKKHNK